MRLPVDPARERAFALYRDGLMPMLTNFVGFLIVNESAFKKSFGRKI
jgi:hypothetical protein